MDDIPPIPDFLKAIHRKAPVYPKEVKGKWVMPEKKETRSQRRHKKEEHDKMVLDAVRSGADTFAKIRKEVSDDLETKQISNALRRCTKSKSIKKNGRRYYPFRN